ncbi:site-specific DNA-methyltransferase [Methanofollis aquaemaris]|uniref:Site-specific DNA-methyltransferase n=1 Tax=Methanofollis aquaemaris TaxID=126734 RepID=A0A8A3S5K0_9EURY|nr:DNA methyltransferase [Methanofollis aquaemaris]QSZ66904.1 site-specific DNA-methyltransferase [Methanofollis aquaemaris]
MRPTSLDDYFEDFTAADGTPTRHDEATCGGVTVPRYANEFWTARQRQASSIHEVSYRACFKPQLPRFFIDLLTRPGDLVYDPFSGRGTTAVEAALLGRRVAANDANPLSGILARPRLSPPDLDEVRARLEEIPRGVGLCAGTDLSMFYHPKTEGELVALRSYLIGRGDEEDAVDRWIRMVATTRLTGHSRGFFSVYTLPPNQAVSPESQRRINTKRGQVPEYRDTHALILRKSRRLLGRMSKEELSALRRAGEDALFLTGDAASTPRLPSGSVALTVTSPPFLDIVQYAKDNWLRCWFNGLDARAIGEGITMARTVREWEETMGQVFAELFRVTKPGGRVAFEVGEVRNGSVSLDEHVVPLGAGVGFVPEGVMVNTQVFTKTSNIWGIRNNRGGTNTNRIVLFRKPGRC